MDKLEFRTKRYDAIYNVGGGHIIFEITRHTFDDVDGFDAIVWDFRAPCETHRYVERLTNVARGLPSLGAVMAACNAHLDVMLTTSEQLEACRA